MRSIAFRRCIHSFLLLSFLTAVSSYSTYAQASSSRIKCSRIFDAATRTQEEANLAFRQGNLAEAAQIESGIKNILETAPEGRVSYITGPERIVEVYSFAPSIRGVFKAKDRSMRETPQAEVAAYKFSQILKLNLVPVTVLRQIDGVWGSLQVFVSGKPAGHRWNRFDDQYALMNMLDFLIFNVDRHSRNILIKGDQIFAIDNGAAFQSQKDFYGRFPPLDPDQIQMKKRHYFWYKNLNDSLTPEVITETLKASFSKKIIQEVIARRKLLLQTYESRTGISLN